MNDILIKRRTCFHWKQWDFSFKDNKYTGNIQTTASERTSKLHHASTPTAHE